MSINQLQQQIDESIQNASGFTRDLFADKHMTAEELQTFVNTHASMTLSSLDRKGKPHAGIVAAGCVDGTMYVGVTPKTALLGNLRRNEDVAFSIGDKVVGRGRAQLVGRAGDQKHLAPGLTGPLKGAIEQDWGGYVYALEPSRVFPAAA
jgi:hypothetical protein